MTYTDIKTLILNASRRYEICELYAEMEVAPDYQTFIKNGISLFEYGFRTGILTEAILAEIPDAELMAQGIYYNKATTIIPAPTLPYAWMDSIEVFFVGGAPAIAIGDSDKMRINFFNCEASVSVYDQAYAEVNGYNTLITMDVNQDATAKCNFRNPSSKEIALFMNDNSKVDIELEAYAILYLDRSIGSNFGRLNAFGKSVANIIFPFDENVLISNAYQDAIINYALA